MDACANSGIRSAENWPVRSALQEPLLMTRFVRLAKIQNNCPRNHNHLSPLIVFLLYFPKYARKKAQICTLVKHITTETEMIYFSENQIVGHEGSSML